MISQSLDELSSASHDVCIIGAGPIGLSLALELDRLGKRTLVLESGREVPKSAKQDLSGARIVDPRVHDEMRIAVSRQLGGTSNLWGGRCQPLDGIDFEERPNVVDCSWPISRKELWPHYERACFYASCGDPVFDAPSESLEAINNDILCTSIERFSNKPSFRRSHKASLRRSSRIDLRLDATVVDFVIEEQKILAVELARADGTRIRVPVRALVIAAGGMESTRLLLYLQRKKPGLFGGTDGPLGRNYMGHLIGEISDITFANSKFAEAFDFFLDGRGSYARRRMIPSDRVQRENKLLNISFWPVVPPISDARHGSGVLSLVYLALAFRPLGQHLVADAIRIRHLSPDAGLSRHIWNIVKDLPPTATHTPAFLWKRYISAAKIPGLFILNKGHRYGLSYHAEHSPNPDSRVKLCDEADDLGLPRLRIDLRFATKDAESVDRSHGILKEWLEKSGIGALDYRQRKEKNVEAILAQASHGTHQIGTIRMAATAKGGIVDRNLKVFDMENLYVASTAVMPTSGQANPTLTGIALGLRLASHLVPRRSE